MFDCINIVRVPGTVVFRRNMIKDMVLYSQIDFVFIDSALGHKDGVNLFFPGLKKYSLFVSRFPAYTCHPMRRFLFRTIILMIVLLRSCLYGFSQLAHYKYDVYNSGLTSDKIYGLVCDSGGYLWLATENGLARFNGVNFAMLSRRDGLADENLVGLQYYDNTLVPLSYFGIVSEVSNLGSYPDIRIRTYAGYNSTLFYFYRIRDTSYWLGNTQTVFRYKGIFYRQGPSYKDILNYLQQETTLPHASGIAWPEKEQVDAESVIKHANSVNRLNRERPGKYNTFLFKKEIYATYKGRTYKLLSLKELPELDEFALIADIEVIGDDLYIAVHNAGGGIFQVKNFYSPRPSPPRRISAPGFATAVCKDHIGNLWYALENKGLYYIEKRLLPFEEHFNFQRDEEQRLRYVYIKARDDQSVLLTSHSEIALYDLNHYRTTFYKNNNAALSLLQTNIPGIVLEGANNYKHKMNHPYYALFVDRIVKYTPRFLVEDEYFFDTDNDNVTCASVYGDHLLACNKNGLVSRIELDKRTVVRKKKVPEMVLCEDMYYANDTTVVFCSQNGAYLTDTAFRVFQTITDKPYKHILFFDQAFYLVNNNELARIERRGKHYIANPLFNTQHQLNKFIIKGVDASPRYIHLLTDKGLLRFKPQDLIPYAAEDLFFYLSSVQSDDSMVLPDNTVSSVVLAPGFQKRSTFNIHFLNPENVLHEKYYALSGPGGESKGGVTWIPFSGNYFTLIQLPPGAYILRLKVRLRDTAIEKIKVYSITIRPLFWQTLFFKIGLILSAVLLFALLLWYWLRRKTDKKYKTLQLSKHLEELENKVYLNQLNPHFLYNALNTLQDYLIEKDTHNGIVYLQKVSALSRNILEFHRAGSIRVSQEIDFLKRYLFIQKVRYSDKFEYEIRVPESMLSLHIPPMLLQPVCENAIEHGFATYKTGGRLEVLFENNDTYIRVVVTDNGKGRKEWVEPMKKKHALYIIRERLELAQVRPAKKIQPLQIHENQPQGICVILNIPIQTNGET